MVNATRLSVSFQIHIPLCLKCDVYVTKCYALLACVIHLTEQ